MNGKEISVLSISVYHNLIVTCSSGSSCMLIWDYEFLRLVARLSLSEDEEGTAAEFLSCF